MDGRTRSSGANQSEGRRLTRSALTSGLGSAPRPVATPESPADSDDDEEEVVVPRHRGRDRNRSRQPSSKGRSLRSSLKSPPEDDAQGSGRRYPSRDRNTLQRFNFESQDTDPPAKRRRIGDAKGDDDDEDDEDDSMVEEEEDEDEEEEEEEGEEEEEELGAARYSLRDRSRIAREARYSPPKEELRERERVIAQRVERRFRERLSGGGRRRRRRRPTLGGGGGGGRTWSDGADMQAADWAVLPDSAGFDHGLGGLPLPGALGTTGQPGQHDTDAMLPAGAGGAANETGRNVEVTPVEVDPSMTFDQVGGLDGYIDKLKEMIFLPLVYPELFERFYITPPRGVLFYGPPGTGKTLVARALAAQASQTGRKVTFFMRKGADILSKWVGEAERMLRLLFAEAERCQPSIIFFDELDGLAPVRSSKQDQIHNSIVSTLLALMDGLTSRGQVVVIGATNRPDALDSALRRPGRFDRELLFPLPNVEAREAILGIHTRAWAERPPQPLLALLAGMTAGYCGADLKALCTEASLVALRRSYPQIYASDDKLLVDPRSVRVQQQDFEAAFRAITPASGRSVASSARLLSPLVAPCLQPQLTQALAALRVAFPPAAAQPAGGPAAAADDEDDVAGASGLQLGGALVGHAAQARALVCGPEGAGQGHLAPALLAALEALPVHTIGLPNLLSDPNSRSPEEALVHAVVEARRAAPAVLYLPHLQLWWATAPPSLRVTLWMLLADLPPTAPLLLLATADVPLSELDPEAAGLFGAPGATVHELGPPSQEQRAAFFEAIARTLAYPPPLPLPRQQRAPPQLPKAPEAEAAAAAADAAAREAAERAARQADVAALRALRMGLREVTTRLLCDRRWRAFAEPVTPEEDPEYLQLVSHPMDLATLLMRVDQRRYPTLAAYMADLRAIATATQQYWAGEARGAREVSRAHALVDEACTRLSERLPQDVVSATNALAERGGLPPGPEAELEAPLVPPPAPGLRQQQQQQADGMQTPSRSTRSREGGTRAGARARGAAIDAKVIFNDPEAHMRRIREERRAERLSQGGIDASQAHDEAGPSSGPLPTANGRLSQEPEDMHVDVDAALPMSQQAAHSSGALPNGIASANGHVAQPNSQDTATAAAAEPPAEGSEPMASGKAGSDGSSPPQALASQAEAAVVQGAHPDDVQAAPSAVVSDRAAAQQQQQQQQQQQETLELAVNPEPPAEPAELPMPEPQPADIARAAALQQRLVQETHGCLLGELEGLHAQLARLAYEHRRAADRDVVVQAVWRSLISAELLPHVQTADDHGDMLHA